MFDDPMLPTEELQIDDLDVDSFDPQPASPANDDIGAKSDYTRAYYHTCEDCW